MARAPSAPRAWAREAAARWRRRWRTRWRGRPGCASATSRSPPSGCGERSARPAGRGAGGPPRARAHAPPSPPRPPPRGASTPAAGRDSALGSPVKVKLAVSVAPDAAGSLLTIDGGGEIGGKLAALGQAVTHRKTRDTPEGLPENLQQRPRRPAPPLP